MISHRARLGRGRPRRVATQWSRARGARRRPAAADGQGRRYGLGAVPVARALEPLEPWGFGVATVAEGEELRERRAITRPILVFTPLLADDYAAMRAAELTPRSATPNAIAAWTAIGGGPWHLAIDTGHEPRRHAMDDDVGAVRDSLPRSPPEGAFTHFHSADLNDGSWRGAGASLSSAALAALPERPRFLHAENSPAIERGGRSPWDLARPGVFLYGVGSGDGATLTPEPVAHLRARVSRSATVDDGETVSYGATWRASGHAPHRDAGARLRRRVPARAQQSRRRARPRARAFRSPAS